MDFIFYYPKVPKFGLCGNGRYATSLTGSELSTLTGIPCAPFPGVNFCATTYPIDVEATVCGELTYEGIVLNDISLTAEEISGLFAGDTTVVDSALERAVVKQSDHFDGKGFLADPFGTGTLSPTSNPTSSPSAQPTTLNPTNAPVTPGPTAAPVTPEPTSSPSLPTVSPTGAPSTTPAPPGGLSQGAMIGIGVGAAASLAAGAMALQMRSRSKRTSEVAGKKPEL